MTVRILHMAAVAVLAAASYCFFDPLEQEPDSALRAASQDTLLAELQEKVSFVFNRHCTRCHRGKYPKMKLNLEADQIPDSLLDAASRQIDSLQLVDTEKPDRSYLLLKIRGGEGIAGERMPINAPPLSEQEIGILEQWLKSLAGRGRSHKEGSKTDAREP